MKIATLTLPLHLNYGGILQAYALQTVLERMGHEVVVIDRKRKKLSIPMQRLPYVMARRIFSRFVLRRKTMLLPERKQNKEYPIISQYTQSFINRYLHCVYPENYAEELKDIEAFVVGSDQVWRPLYYKFAPITQVYLDFCQNRQVKRVAYAPSFGTDEWEYTAEQTAACKELLQKFDAVSVREKGGVLLCREHFGIEAEHLLDPTMLLNSSDYRELIAQCEFPIKKFEGLMTYVLDTDTQIDTFVKGVALRNKWKIYNSNSKYKILQASVKERIQAPVEQWLSGFSQASMVITDSFHACVFSILFHKPFVVFGNQFRGMSRFNSLLELFGLQKRLVSTVSEAEQIINEPIDWQIVDERLEELRMQSMLFLKNSLNK